MKKKFSINCEMEERWIPYFIGLLKNMERNGEIGHSSMIAFYADGDGDFRPRFDVDVATEDVYPILLDITVHHKNYDKNRFINFYDAG